MEHAVYICGWSKARSGFSLWVKSRPWIRVEGATYDEAEDRLIEAIWNAGGAMQAVLEFDPPLPQTDLQASFSTPELYLICGDDVFGHAEFTPANARGRVLEEMFQRADEYYQLPVCRSCRCANSPRSEKPLRIDSVESGYDGAFGRVESQILTDHKIFVEEFLSLLTTKEKRRLEFQPVEQSGRARRKFYELVGAPGVPLVGVAGFSPNGWFCEACGHKVFGYRTENMEIDSFVSKDDLPNPLPEVFTVGTPPDIELCVTGSRWAKMLGKNGTRGFVTRPLGIPPSSQVLHSPKLKSLQSQTKG